MPSVAVLAPMRTELAPVIRRLDLRRDRPPEPNLATWSGRCGDPQVVAAVAGVGTRHAADVAARMLALHHPEHLVIVGVAGGLAPDLVVGDLVVPAVVVDLDNGDRYDAHPLGTRTLSGELLTSNELHGWDVLERHADAGALAIDMETAAIAAVCEQSGVPWTAIRGLSDVVRDGTVDQSTLALVREDGRTDLGGVLRHLARHPGRVGALAAMGKDSARATGAVADALHDALVGGPQAGGIGADAR